MRHEYSCGAVLYERAPDGIYYILVADRNGKCGFPKGHRKKGEREVDTAKREIFEETGAVVEIDEGFRTGTSYPLHRGGTKHVTYWVAEYRGGELQYPEGEITGIYRLKFGDALNKLEFPNLESILRRANAYIRKKITASAEEKK